ncbi:hypothetical protein [Treponema putidum]|uniref:Uncharacterized protein n=1 Tax=Treponema putidum TaxID=221027 RepID=A0AAE9SM49_9SPIR|nr:hypothetical protein [Treponema putidum]UTY32007.1 hypothetical protein E4N75_11375 [Treponema putidum]UTY34384.1 hypothetical protein E4N74_10520 [Treponema putidum]
MKKIRAIIFNSINSVNFMLGGIFCLIGFIEMIVGLLISIPQAMRILFFQGLIFFCYGLIINQLSLYDQISIFILTPVRGKDIFKAKLIYSILTSFFALMFLGLILFLINIFIPIGDIKFMIFIGLVLFPLIISFSMILSALSIKGGLLRFIIIMIVGYGLFPAVSMIMISDLPNLELIKSFFERVHYPLFLLAVYIISSLIVLISYFIGKRNFNKFRFKSFMIMNQRNRQG